MMRYIFLFILMFSVSCASSNPPLFADDDADAAFDSADVAAESDRGGDNDSGAVDDLKTDDTRPDITPNDDGGIHEQTMDCRSQLTPYQCLSNDDCGQGEICSGVVSCGGKGCFGYCDVYPGTCVPQHKNFCTSSSQCPQYYVCTGARACTGGSCLAGTIPGLCRYAGPGRCYTDDDCAKGAYCAQSVYCEKGPCWGQDLPGVCVTKPDSGCLDNRDCDKGKSCQGAQLCSTFENCPTKAGKCENMGACMDYKDCADPLYSFCEGMYACKSSNCIFPDSQGFCVGQPGPSACWTNKDCAEGYMCKGARPCKPGSYCDTKGLARVGYCVKDLTFSGIDIRLPDKIVAGQPFPVAVINHTGVTVSIHKTYTFSFQLKKPDGTFVTVCPDTKRPQYCLESGPLIPLLDGGAYTRMERVSRAGTYRLEFHIYTADSQGENDITRDDILSLIRSVEFEVTGGGG